MSSSNIYEKEQQQSLSDTFRAPGAKFRGAPFWSWNTKLDPDQLRRQIDVFKEMGLGGFHMHSRTGLNTPYLGDEYMAAVKACVDKAEKENMIAWLYDEDRWPSGAAGGLVTQEDQYRGRHLLFTPLSYEARGAEQSGNFSGARGCRTGNGELLARYAVKLRDGFLVEYRRLAKNEKVPAGYAAWYAYLETSAKQPWFNNESYVDTLNPKAIERFVDITHERYKEIVGDRFGDVIPAIFTDEPQFACKTCLGTPEEERDVILPFTGDFPDSFAKTYGADILGAIPEIIWELPEGQYSVVRYQYHDHVAERFAAAFADTIGGWCSENGIALTGHMMEEPTLRAQTCALGEAMRSYRSFQLPGIDMLCDKHEYTTAKQAQSASHQYGRNGVLSELYGVTNWDFDFAGHKSQGDWQAALGVTVRVHHLSWVSMAGEAKRDYPASISYQSPWYREYPIVEDHFARLNSVLTRGYPDVKVGMVHPVESYWLVFGPTAQTGVARQELEHAFSQSTRWLLNGLVDFDYICESLLPALNPRGQGERFAVGEMAYDVVVVPPMLTMRASTAERLEAFVDAGGTLIFAGSPPELVDALPSARVTRLAERAQQVDFSQQALLGALESVRDLDVRSPSGAQVPGLLHQFRTEGNSRYLFVCNTAKHGQAKESRVRIRGDWQLSLMDTSNGVIEPVAAEHVDSWTVLDWVFHAQGHLLLKMTPAHKSTGRAIKPQALAPHQVENKTISMLEQPVPVTLHEPNTLVLDQPEWRLNDGGWNPREEILRLDNQVRAKLGLSPRGGRIAQPWLTPEDPAVLGNVQLRFTIHSEVHVEAPSLAVENPVDMAILLDGSAVASEDDGWWVDEAIRTVPLPAIAPGDHELVLQIPYRRKTNLEWCYLLGDFGIELRGRDARLTAPVRELAFGDWTKQGLPFYTGNLTYHCTLDVSTEPARLHAPHFSGAMLGVQLNGEKKRGIAFAPYETYLGPAPAGPEGELRLDLTLFANRHNAFGQLHWAQPAPWAGPQAWRTQGDEWCYEYKLKPLGILIAPRVLHTT